MDKTRRFLVLIFLMCLTEVGIFAYDFEVDGVFYNITSIEEKTVEVTFSSELNYQQRKVVIPAEVDWNGYHFSVKGISTWAFCKTNYPNKVDSLIISHGIEYIKKYAFQSANFSMISIPNTIKSIGDGAFGGKYIANTTDFYVEDYNWLCSSGLFDSYPVKNIYVNNVKLTENLVIPDGVKCIREKTFSRLNWIKTLKISGSVEYVDAAAFEECENLEKVEIEEGVKELYGNVPKDLPGWTYGAFAKCYKLKIVILPSSISVLKDGCFSDSHNLKEVYCYIADPFSINSCFSNGQYLSTTLKIPLGTLAKYQNTEGWKKFVNIDECLMPRNPILPSYEKCATPTISYNNGKLTFKSDTEGAICHSTITDDDIKSYDDDDIQLGVTYNISVYATKEGFMNSETTTATLCWIDKEPKKEGVTDGIAQMAAMAVMVKAEGGQLTIEGAEDNTNISAYSLEGVPMGTSTSKNGVASLITPIRKNSIFIVKIGNKSMKVIMK